MKSLVIFALFLVANSSFLRQLEDEAEAITISAATLTDACVVSGGDGKLNLTLTSSAAINATGEDTLKALLTGQGTSKIESVCTAEATTVTCEDDLTGAVVGTYTLESVTDTAADETVTTFELEEGVSAVFIIAETVTLATQQETAQTVDLKDDQKKSFKIALDTTTEATGAPAVFAGNDATTPLSACTLSEDAATVTCSPTEDEMEHGEKYKIYYNKGCTKTDSGIEVTFENGSVFMTVSKIALIAFALLF